MKNDPGSLRLFLLAVQHHVCHGIPGVKRVIKRIQRFPDSCKVIPQLAVSLLHRDSLDGQKALNIKQIILHIMFYRTYPRIELLNLPYVVLHLSHFLLQNDGTSFFYYVFHQLPVNIIGKQNSHQCRQEQQRNQQVKHKSVLRRPIHCHLEKQKLLFNLQKEIYDQACKAGHQQKQQFLFVNTVQRILHAPCQFYGRQCQYDTGQKKAETGACIQRQIVTRFRHPPF